MSDFPWLARRGDAAADNLPRTNDNTHDAAPHDEAISDTLQVVGRCGETLSAWAYPGHVVIEAAEGRDGADVHLTIETLDRHIEHLMAQRAMALLLRDAESADRAAVRPVPWLAGRGVQP